MKDNIYIEYSICTGQKSEKKFKLWLELLLFMLTFAVFSVIMVFIPHNNSVKEGVYYVTGLYTQMDNQEHTKKTLYYIVTKEQAKEYEKIDLYDYYFIPVDQINESVRYKTGDRIILEKPYKTNKTIMSNDVHSAFFIAFAILLITSIAFLTFLT